MARRDTPHVVRWVEVVSHEEPRDDETTAILHAAQIALLKDTRVDVTYPDGRVLFFDGRAK